MDRISFGGVIVEDANIIHDSTKELFRSPLGAVPRGTQVTFGLKVSGFDFEQARICILHGETTDRITMVAEGDVLRARYTTPGYDAYTESGYVLWYWFELVLYGGEICYYGAEPPFPSGLGRVYHNPPPSFQLTVFNENFVTPDWTKNAVLYQIFPDRFACGDPEAARKGVEYHRAKGRTDIWLHENWDDIPVYEASGDQKFYMPGDLFGGDLEGIRQRLPYLKELGVSLLYLNPIFESSSNHRYNTGDYCKVDPILGGDEAFKKLIAEAEGMGIRIVLDGVFSHTGDDSVYFNKYGRYDDVGAYQSQESPYYSWYKFSEYPDKYTSWWGFETLPEVNETDPGWQDFIISGRESVFRKWITDGAAGYRLDVADELPDETIEQMRAALKSADEEAFLIGEVWEDATTKQSYNRPRTYALGRGLDSVMNYPFLNQTVEFLRGKTNAGLYGRFLEHQKHSYPPQMYYSMMNLLSSHDVSRIRSMLSGDFDPHEMTRAEQAQFSLSAEAYELGGKRQRLAAAIQFALPGIPSVYYGDETGMTGLLDPFNRKTWHEEDKQMYEWYRTLAELRKMHPVLSTGCVAFFSTNCDVLGIFRHTVNGRDYFGKKTGVDGILTIINPTKEQHRIVFDFRDVYYALHLDHYSEIMWRNMRTANSLLSNQKIPVEKGLLEIDVPALDAEIFRLI